MYPSKKHPSYGTFVKEFADKIRTQNAGGKTTLSVIRGRTTSRIRKLLKYLFFYIRTICLLLLNKYDIVYVHTIVYTSIPLWIASALKKLPTVFNVHGADVLSKNKFSTLLRKIYTPLLEKSLMIVTPTPYFKGVVVNQFPSINADKIFVSPSGGLSSIFYNNTSSTCKDGTFTIGYLSRIGEQKGWDTFIKAIVILHNRNNLTFKAIIAGRGPKQEQLVQMINDYDASDYIEFMDLTSVEHNNIPDIYKKMDLFIFPSYYHAESLGLVGIEAMACGLPVIGSRIGAIESYLVDGLNGFLFEPENENDLVDKIEKYLSLSDKQKKDISENAYKTALQYESNYVAKQLYNKLESLIK